MSNPILPRRLALLGLLGAATAAPLAIATAQPLNWYEDQRRRREYERWRAAEWRRREREARRRHRSWSRDSWEEERERQAWAQRQRWYR